MRSGKSSKDIGRLGEEMGECGLYSSGTLEFKDGSNSKWEERKMQLIGLWAGI